MKVKIIMEGVVKFPKKGDQFCGYGLKGRMGFSCEDITRVYKNCIIVDGQKISMKQYAWRELLNSMKKKVKVEIKK